MRTDAERERRRAIIQEAYQTIEQIDAMLAGERADQGPMTVERAVRISRDIQYDDSRVDWRHAPRFDGSLVQQPEPVERRRAPPAPAVDWRKVDQRIDARVNRECAKVARDVGRGIGELLAEAEGARVKLAGEIHDLKVETARLTNLVATMREERAAARGLPPDLRAVN